jgi:hypothetical protein
MTEDDNEPEFETEEVITEEVTIDVNDAPSMMKDTLKYTSGHCRTCGRYTAVPIIDGVVQCKCKTS